MKIAQVTTSIDSTYGGIARSVVHTIEALLGLKKLQVSLYCLQSLTPIKKFFKSKVGTLDFCNATYMGYSKELNTYLKEGEFNLFHGQGLWQLPVHQMAKIARRLNVPYIITPRGMLEPWSLRQKRIKKKIALKLYQYNDLKKASCLHATAPMEAESIRDLGLKNPIAIIPNGIPLEDFKTKDFDKANASKNILFLSRIHPKKGIELLIEAWNQLPPKLTQDWSIDIIGNGDTDYIAKLRESIALLGLSNSIQIKDPLDGQTKMKAYQNAQLFVLPTYSENFGVVVAEALACGTPVITTTGTPWEDLETHECGWWINIGVEALKSTLEKALQLPPEQLAQMGIKGRQLIEKKYSMQAVAQQMYELYEWILKRKEKPTFVRLD